MYGSIYQMLELVSWDGAQVDEVRKFTARQTSSGELPLSAESVYPMPPCFDLFRDPTVSVREFIEVLEIHRSHSCCPLPMTNEIRKTLLATYGAANRYEWALNNWGMMTDFFDVEEWGKHVKDAIRFRTSQTIPYRIYKSLSKLFLEPEFVVHWQEGYGHGAGIIEFHKGVKKRDDRFKRNSPEGRKIDEYLFTKTDAERAVRYQAPF